MQKIINKLFIIIITTVIAGCGFHLCKNNNGRLSGTIKTLIINNYDLYSPLMFNIRQQLRVRGINIIADSKLARRTFPIFLLGKEIQEFHAVSTFISGINAEYAITITVNAQLLFSGIENKSYPIKITLHNFIFNNSNSILAYDTEKNLIIQSLRQRISEQIVDKILLITNLR
ncbi:LPS assembly lipoprotein LptE [Pantoea sp. Mhis]|uniref:LPS assembly lipoprotein LptE n=1 Tax=Pantoea sp. Mhis TaxID=2576759 RepID=UPI00135A5EA5|nr:LPS assembly lipoprotein LptE [Pantoea sp. Mhis]